MAAAIHNHPKPELRLGRDDFGAVAGLVLSAAHTLRFRAPGGSMAPFIRDGDALEVCPIDPRTLRRGDVALCRRPGGGLFAHRVVAVRRHEGTTEWITQGDASPFSDGPCCAGDVLGRVVAVERGGRRTELAWFGPRLAGYLWAVLRGRARRLCRRLAALRRFCCHR